MNKKGGAVTDGRKSNESEEKYSERKNEAVQ